MAEWLRCWPLAPQRQQLDPDLAAHTLPRSKPSHHVPPAAGVQLCDPPHYSRELLYDELRPQQMALHPARIKLATFSVLG